MPEKPEGCVIPAKGPVKNSEESTKDEKTEKKEEMKTMVTAGKVAPDFEAVSPPLPALGNLRNCPPHDSAGL